MTRPTAEDRKAFLDEARRALRSGNLQMMQHALERLPSNGSKATALRAMLRAKIGCGAEDSVHAGALVARPVDAIPTHAVYAAEGLRYQFEVSDCQGGALFSVQVRGSAIMIAANLSHPAFPTLAHPCGMLLSGAGKGVLAAWARLYLECGSERRREGVDNLAIDWARALAVVAQQVGEHDEELG